MQLLSKHQRLVCALFFMSTFLDVKFWNFVLTTSIFDNDSCVILFLRTPLRKFTSFMTITLIPKSFKSKTHIFSFFIFYHITETSIRFTNSTSMKLSFFFSTHILSAAPSFCCCFLGSNSSTTSCRIISGFGRVFSDSTEYFNTLKLDGKLLNNMYDSNSGFLEIFFYYNCSQTSKIF